MIPSAGRLARVRTFILGWLAVWMLAVPLVHIHPNEQAGPFHNGVAHTVFSPDLPGEFEAGPHSHSSVQPSGRAVPDAIGHASHEHHDQEITLSLLTSSPDPHLGKPMQAEVALHGTPPSETGTARACRFSVADRSPALPFLRTELSSRAPPTVTV